MSWTLVPSPENNFENSIYDLYKEDDSEPGSLLVLLFQNTVKKLWIWSPSLYLASSIDTLYSLKRCKQRHEKLWYTGHFSESWRGGSTKFPPHQSYDCCTHHPQSPLCHWPCFTIPLHNSADTPIRPSAQNIFQSEWGQSSIFHTSRSP